MLPSSKATIPNGNTASICRQFSKRFTLLSQRAGRIGHRRYLKVPLLFGPISLNRFLFPGTGHSNRQSVPPGLARERNSKCGIVYSPDNEPETIAATVIRARKRKQNAIEYVRDRHNPDAVFKSLEILLQRVAAK